MRETRARILMAAAAALMFSLVTALAQDAAPRRPADRMLEDASLARGIVREVRLEKKQLVLVSIVGADSLPSTQTLQLIPDARVNLVSDDGLILRLGHLRQVEKGMYVEAGGQYAEKPGGAFQAALLCAGQKQGSVGRLMKAELERRQKGRPSLTRDESTTATSKVKIYD